MTRAKRRPDVCDICRKPSRSGHRYCGDHRDPRELPTGEELLRWIEAQECPLCRDGRTFKVLANHTVKAHGVSGDDIREAAGLILAARICSPEHTEEQRERMAAIGVGVANLNGGRSVEAKQATGERTGARMRSYKRLADLHRGDYLRLLAEESAREDH